MDHDARQDLRLRVQQELKSNLKSGTGTDFLPAPWPRFIGKYRGPYTGLGAILRCEQHIKRAFGVGDEIVHYAIVLSVIVIDELDTIRRARVDISIRVGH
jgi:hypothetical protein